MTFFFEYYWVIIDTARKIVAYFFYTCSICFQCDTKLSNKIAATIWHMNCNRLSSVSDTSTLSLIRRKVSVNPIEIIEQLKNEKASNPAAGAVFEVFAKRKRARNNLTIGGLIQKMKLEGHTFDKVHYERILQLFSTLGLGKLTMDAHGRPIALRDVKMTFHSIGMAALGQSGELDAWKRRTKYTSFEKVAATRTPRVAPSSAQPQRQAPPPANHSKQAPVSITIMYNGKPINLEIPKECTETEIANLVVRFRDAIAP